ncbi:hypothetical protein B6S44_05300 [Bosea sp. Tri-44]|nr:hypothetical protein B6S44_05300 [Bosea sp. Tri-44]
MLCEYALLRDGKQDSSQVFCLSPRVDGVDKEGCFPVPIGPGLGVSYDWNYIRAHERAREVFKLEASSPGDGIARTTRPLAAQPASLTDALSLSATR